MDVGDRAMQGAIAEKSYQTLENRISPIVDMTVSRLPLVPLGIKKSC